MLFAILSNLHNFVAFSRALETDLLVFALCSLRYAPWAMRLSIYAASFFSSSKFGMVATTGNSR